MASLNYTSKFELSSVMCLIAGLTLALLMHVSQAQDTPRDFLAPHIAARANVSVGPMTWSTTLAAYAMNYANKRVSDCNLTPSNGPYGENLAWSSTALSAGQAVKLWVAQKQYYDHASNSCVGGDCLSYTQVVWRKSTRLGCASVTCTSGRGTFVICSYDPPGNVNGQRPY